MPSRSRTAFARIEDLAWSQGGLVTSRQLGELAVPSSTVRHGYGAAFEATEKRQARLAGLGILVVPITPNRLRRDASGVMRDIDSALRAASGRPRPDVRIENDGVARRLG